MLEFEEPIKSLEDKIEELINIGSDGQVNSVEEINLLQRISNGDFPFLRHILYY